MYPTFYSLFCRKPANMIQSIEFSNYRSFKDSTVFTFEPNSSKQKTHNLHYTMDEGHADEHKTALLKFGIIYGANASGKTNIIRMLHALVEKLNGGYDILYNPFKFDASTAVSDGKLKLEFDVAGSRYIYEITFNRALIVDEKLLWINGSRKLVFKRRNIKGQNKAVIEYGPTIKSKDNTQATVQTDSLILKLFHDSLYHENISPAAEYLASMIVINGYNQVMFDNMLVEVNKWVEDNPKNLRRLSELVKMSDTGVHSMAINNEGVTPERKIDMYHGAKEIEQYKLNFVHQSQGTKMIYLIGGMMLKAIEQGVPIFIDEMDAVFHTYITRWLLEIFTSDKINTKKSQMLLTSHDINLLDETKIRKDQIWFVEKNEKGESDLFPLSDFTDVREDTPFAKWYMYSKFGATPNIGAVEDLFE